MAALLFSLGWIALAFGLGGIYLGKEPGPTAIANLVAAGILIIGAIVVSVVSIRQRQAGLARGVWGRAFIYTVIALVVTAGILVAASRLNVNWDLTEPRTYTVSDFSRRILEDLSVDVKAFYVADPGAPPQERLLLEQFAKASEHFHLQIISPQELEPEAARKIARSGSQLVMHAGGRPRKVPAITERAIIQTVLDFSMRASTTLCSLTGHGEFSLKGHGAQGLSTFKAMLEKEGFRTTDLLLAAKDDVPDACDIVVIAAPEKKLLPAEQDALQAFVDQGGRLLVFSEPRRPVEPGPILHGAGVTALEAIVVDEEASLLGSPAKGTEPIVHRFTDHHPIVEGLSEQTGVVFSGARPLILRGQDARGFVYSDTTSRIEMLAEEGWEGTVADAVTLPPWMRRNVGPFPLGASVIRPTDSGNEARIVVFGDIDFATNRLLGVLYNEDMAINAVYFLADREDQIHLRPKVEELYQAPLIPERTLSAFHSVVLLIPEAILVLGLVVWFRRRRL
jgi:hypothetical protein